MLSVTNLSVLPSAEFVATGQLVTTCSVKSIPENFHGASPHLSARMKLSLLRYLCELPRQGRINLCHWPVNEYRL